MVPSLNVNKLTVSLFALLFLFSCSKDSDLLEEYALSDDYVNHILIRDDIFTTNGNSIVLDVLSNDSFPEESKVSITGISDPSHGIVEIREDNTILYTPIRDESKTNESTDEGNDSDTTSGDEEENTDSGTTEEEEDTANSEDESNDTEENGNEEGSDTDETDTTQEDTFTYTTETENEDGTTDTKEGNVTVEYEEEETTEEEEEEEETTEEEEEEEETTEEEEEEEEETTEEEEEEEETTEEEEEEETTEEEEEEEEEETTEEEEEEEETTEEEEEEEEEPSCTPNQVSPEYSLDGVWSSGQNALTVAHGTEVVLSALPNTVGYTIQLPGGTVVGDNFNLGAVTQSYNGTYIMTSSEGCQTTLNLTVEEKEEEPENNHLDENARFVTVNGNSGNDGRSENKAWSLEHAFNVAQAGQTIYIKAGNYGNKKILRRGGGSSGNPIRFKGYTSVPEDIQAQNESTFHYQDQIDASKMPLFEGNVVNGQAQGWALDLRGSNIELYNIQFIKYERAIMSDGNNNVFNNLIVDDIGKDVQTSVYSGIGMRIKGNNNKVYNSIVRNAGGEGITMNNCDNCEVKYSEVYSNDTRNPTDYYILLTGGTQNTVVQYCTVRRKTKLSHGGHGLCGKNGAVNNQFLDSKVINTSIEMSYTNVNNNLIKNCSVESMFRQNGDVYGTIDVANGSHHNTFENVTINGSWGAINFKDWNEPNPNDGKNAGHDNEFINVTVTNSLNAIHFNEFQKTEGSANNNTFRNCTFKDVSKVFQVNRPNSGTRLIGCSVINVPTLWRTSNGYNYSLNSNTVFQNMTWTNIGFQAP